MAPVTQLAGKSQSDTFCFTWKVENVHLSNRSIDGYFSTPTFQVGILQNTMWEVRFAPAGFNDVLYMGCSLRRVSSAREHDEPESIKLRWKICVIAEGGTVRFEKCFTSILKCRESETVSHFIRKSQLLPTDTPQNNLTIYCEMKNDSLFSAEQDLKYDFEALSSDLTALLESGFRSDFTIYCRGVVFNVHKFILISRWPQFCERFEIEDISTRLDIIIMDIEASTLKTFLAFLYSGKLQRKDISMELCTYMHEQYCDVLLSSLETPVSSLEFVTHMCYETKYITWEVGDDSAWNLSKTPFYRVIPLERVYACDMIIHFDFEKRDGEDWLKLGVEFTSFDATKPIRLNGEISFINKGTVVYSRKFNYLKEVIEDWCFPLLVKKSELLPNKRNSKFIEIKLCLCDGNYPARQVSASINNASSFREVKDLRKLTKDLVKSSYEKDFKLKIGDRLLDVHSPVLAARSAEFRKLIQENTGIIEIEEYMSKEASDSLIRHLYGENLLDLHIASMISLNIVAKKYALASLEEKTRKMLDDSFNG